MMDAEPTVVILQCPSYMFIKSTSVNYNALYRAVQFTRATAWSPLDRLSQTGPSLYSSVQSFSELHSSPLVPHNTLEIAFFVFNTTQVTHVKVNENKWIAQ